MEDVLSELEDEMVNDAVRLFGEEFSYSGMTDYLDCLKAHSKTYLIMMSNRSSRLKEKMEERLGIFTASDSDSSLFDSDMTKLCRRINDYASMIIVEDWLKNGALVPSAEMSRMIISVSKVTYAGFCEYLKTLPDYIQNRK